MPVLSLTFNPVTSDSSKFRATNFLFPDGIHKENDAASEETIPCAKSSTNAVPPLSVSTSSRNTMSTDELLVRSGVMHVDDSVIVDGGVVETGCAGISIDMVVAGKVGGKVWRDPMPPGI